MWAHAHTDLTDFYRDRLTLRQIHVRIKSLPPDAHLWAVLDAEEEREKQQEEARELQAILDKFKP